MVGGEQYCCAALCLVAQDVRNCVLIINEGAIPHMLAGAKDGDMVTKQSCCAVLSTLSSKASQVDHPLLYVQYYCRNVAPHRGVCGIALCR